MEKKCEITINSSQTLNQVFDRDVYNAFTKEDSQKKPKKNSKEEPDFIIATALSTREVLADKKKFAVLYPPCFIERITCNFFFFF